MPQGEMSAATDYRAAREIGWFVANFMVTEAIVFWWALGTWWSKGATQSEVAEGALILAIALVPPGFILLYPVFRLATRALYRRHTEFQVLAGAWLPGTTVAVALMVAGEVMGFVNKALGR
jgi:hypothetical protein